MSSINSVNSLKALGQVASYYEDRKVPSFQSLLALSERVKEGDTLDKNRNVEVLDDSPQSPVESEKINVNDIFVPPLFLISSSLFYFA
jgi:hypothetical protein